MTIESVRTTRPASAVAALVESIGDVLNGTKPDPHGIAEVFWSAFAHSLATSVHCAFIVKSSHGKDELGQSWPDLDPKTKAYSRPDGRKGLPLHTGKPTVYGNTHRPTLTKEQDRMWRILFVKKLAYFRTQMTGPEASAEAAKVAWNYVKSKMGATTILAYASNRTLLLLQRSGRLETSLRPGEFSGEKYSPPIDQVFTIDQKGLTWGSAVEYASKVSVKRPLWPESIDVWLKRALDFAISAVIKKVASIV